jgi:transposase-like protein
MAPKKLSEADKQEIVELYRQPGETTTTLADRYGVSNSTISRILKGALDKKEYNALVQAKRTAGKNNAAAPSPPQTKTDKETDQAKADKAKADKEPPVKASTATETVEAAAQVKETAAEAPPAPSETAETAKEKPRIRKRSQTRQAEDKQSLESKAESEADRQLGIDDIRDVPAPQTTSAQAAAEDLESFDSDLLDEDEEDDQFDDGLDEELELEFGDDLDDLDDLEDEDDEEDEEDEDEVEPVQPRGRTSVQILPFAEANLPRTCYLVIDRSAELITRPLREFRHLGQIPEGEIQAVTLPVFDNHRVARRFSRRNQRVIKIPDGQMLEKTSVYLQAKGITRLLIDGQVYALG